MSQANQSDHHHVVNGLFIFGSIVNFNKGRDIDLAVITLEPEISSSCGIITEMLLIWHFIAACIDKT